MPKVNLEELAFAKYWDGRYSHGQDALCNKKEPYEWYKTYQTLLPLFRKHLPAPPSACHILHLGCGNSTLTADLHEAGYSNQTSVDFSAVAIAAMEAKYAALRLTWTVMDVRDLRMAEGSVDLAIDKATMDGMFHGSVWDPPEDVREYIGKYVDEVARVLKPTGKWMYITYRQPHFVTPLLVRDGVWDVDVEVLDDLERVGSFEYYGYVMTKK